MKKTVWVVDFEDKWIKEIEYTKSPYCLYYSYDKYETKEECIKEILSYYENKVSDAKNGLNEVRKLFKP